MNGNQNHVSRGSVRPLHATLAIFGITTLVWIHAFATINIRMRIDEIAALALVFVVPAGLVSAAIWILLDARWWRRLLGIVLLLPSVIIWGLSLMLANAGFRIH